MNFNPAAAAAAAMDPKNALNFFQVKAINALGHVTFKKDISYENATAQAHVGACPEPGRSMTSIFCRSLNYGRMMDLW